MKVRFVKSIQVYMKDTKADSNLQMNVKICFSKSDYSFKGVKKYEARIKKDNLEAWKEKMKSSNFAKKEEKKGKRERLRDEGVLSTFDDVVESFHLPQDASAEDIEKACRNVIIDTPLHTTAQLAKYLMEKFDSKGGEKSHGDSILSIGSR